MLFVVNWSSHFSNDISFIQVASFQNGRNKFRANFPPPPQLEIASSESPHGGKKLLGQIRVFVSRKGRRQVGYRENEISRAAVAAGLADSRIDKNTDTGIYYVHNIELI